MTGEELAKKLHETKKIMASNEKTLREIENFMLKLHDVESNAKTAVEIHNHVINVISSHEKIQRDRMRRLKRLIGYTEFPITEIQGRRMRHEQGD